MKDDDPIHIDIGIYGFCEKENFDKIKVSRKMERYAIDLNGYMVTINKIVQ